MNTFQLKHWVLLLSLLVFGNIAKGQVFMDTSAMNLIHNNRTGSEGDMYMDTINGVFRIGLTNGELGYVTDNQSLDSIQVIDKNSIAIYLENGGADTISLSFLYDSTKSREEWVDGDTISLSNIIYAKQALVNGDTIAFTDTASLGIGTASPTASIDVAKGGVRLREYNENRADDTTAYLNVLYTDSIGNVRSGRREIIPPSPFINITIASVNNTFNYFTYYKTQLESVGLEPIPLANLDFYVLSFDGNVFENVSIDAFGVLKFDVKANTSTSSCIDVRFYTK